MSMVGVGYRRELAGWIDADPPQVECLEITAEHFYEGGLDRLRSLRKRRPLFVHGLGLSLGTPGPLDDSEVARFRTVVEAADPLWISEHVAFTRTEEVDLGHLNPLVPSRDTLQFLVDHARTLSARCNRPLILENITSHIRIAGDMGETDFLNLLCDQAGCGLLLDVTNLYINSRNHDFDPLAWLRELSPERIVQLHVVGYTQRGGRYMDDHAAAIQEDLMELVRAVASYAPFKAIIIERDRDFPRPEALALELQRLKDIVTRD